MKNQYTKIIKKMSDIKRNCTYCGEKITRRNANVRRDITTSVGLPVFQSVCTGCTKNRSSALYFMKFKTEDLLDKRRIFEERVKTINLELARRAKKGE